MTSQPTFVSCFLNRVRVCLVQGYPSNGSGSHFLSGYPTFDWEGREGRATRLQEYSLETLAPLIPPNRPDGANHPALLTSETFSFAHRNLIPFVSPSPNSDGARSSDHDSARLRDLLEGVANGARPPSLAASLHLSLARVQPSGRGAGD